MFIRVAVLALFVLAIASLSSSSSPTRVPLCEAEEKGSPRSLYWSADFRSCLRCRKCLVVLAECTEDRDAVCGDADDLANFASGDSSSSPTRKVLQTVLNEAQTREEFLRQLERRQLQGRGGGGGGGGGDDGGDVGDSGADDSASGGGRTGAVDEIVDGFVKYEGVRAAGDSLHSDLRAIERELLAATRRGRGKKTTPNSANKNVVMKTIPASTTNKDLDLVVLGKKRLFAAPDKKSPVKATTVYGAVRVNPTVAATGGDTEDAAAEAAVVAVPDEIALVHNLLKNEKKENDNDGSSSGLSSSSSLSLGHHRLLLLVLLPSAGVSVVAVMAFFAVRKWSGRVRRLKASFLDNSGGTGRNTLLSSHDSSFRRSTESRLTNQTSAPNSPSTPTAQQQQQQQQQPQPPQQQQQVLSESPSRQAAPQFYLSYVDERGRTQLKGGRELPV